MPEKKVKYLYCIHCFRTYKKGSLELKKTCLAIKQNYVLMMVVMGQLLWMGCRGISIENKYCNMAWSVL